MDEKEDLKLNFEVNTQVVPLAHPSFHSGLDKSSFDPTKANKYEGHAIKMDIFFEFFWYFLLNSVLGPFSYFYLVKFVKHGRTLCKNLNIFGSKNSNIRTVLWVLKVFCVVSTFTIGMDSQSQFWLLLYTELSLNVLQAAFYSSFTETEIHNFRMEDCETSDEIFETVLATIENDNQIFLEKDLLNAAFPEIESETFHFIFPPSDEHKIPKELYPYKIKGSSYYFGDIKQGTAIAGEIYAKYLADASGFKKYKTNITVIKWGANLLIIIRVLLPLIGHILCGVLNYINEGSQYETCQGMQSNGFVVTCLYVAQQVFYTLIIYRIVEVYLILFLGLVLYKKRYDLLSTLNTVILSRSVAEQEYLLKIPVTIPQNVLNWYNIRRIFSEFNKQAFVIVDLNMSFLMLFFIFFVIMIISINVGGILGNAEFIQDFKNIMLHNSDLLAATIFFMLTTIVILVADIVLGLLINLQYGDDIAECTYHYGRIQTMYINKEFYFGSKLTMGDNVESDLYLKNIQDIKDMLVEDFPEKFPEFTDRMKDSMSFVLQSLNQDMTYHPETVLGITTNIPNMVIIGGIVTAIGFATINEIVQYIQNFK